MKRTGFTLIELLVVLGIIAILAAILFPVLLLVQGNARRATCLNNLRQLGKGVHLYADEWNGSFPISRVEDGEWGNPSRNWAGVYVVDGKCDPSKGQIFPYVRNVGVYLCPSDRGVKPLRINEADALPYPLSYSMNNITDYRTASQMAVLTAKVGLLVHEDRSTIDDGDFYWLGWNDGGSGTNEPSIAHNGGTCVIYVDQHAQWHKYETVMAALTKGEWDPLHLCRRSQ